MSNQKRKVCFNPRDAVISLSSLPIASEMTIEENHSLWYSIDELKTLKDNAREDSRLIRQKYEESISHHMPQHEACGRGLELCIDLEQQENKNVTRHIIVKYQHRLRLGLTGTSSVIADPTLYLANVSKRLSQRSRDVALSTARKDYIAAYPEMESLVSASMDPIPIADFPCQKRILNFITPDRSSIVCYGTERRVKRRISM